MHSPKYRLNMRLAVLLRLNYSQHLQVRKAPPQAVVNLPERLFNCSRCFQVIRKPAGLHSQCKKVASSLRVIRQPRNPVSLFVDVPLMMPVQRFEPAPITWFALLLNHYPLPVPSSTQD